MKLPLRKDVHDYVACMLEVRAARLAESDDEAAEDARDDLSETLWRRMDSDERAFLQGVCTDLHLLEGDELVVPWSGTPEEFRARLREALRDDSPSAALLVLRQRGGTGYSDFRVRSRRARLYRDFDLDNVAELFAPDVRFPRKRKLRVPVHLPA